jgi:heptosyltransferase II
MAQPTRLLLRAPNWLGDLVMALPAMRMVRQAHPDTRLTIAAPKAFAPVFREETSLSAAVLPLDRPGTSDEAVALRRGRFDTVILFPNSFGSAWLAWRAGVRERWGYAAAGRRVLLTRAIRRPRQRVHQVEYYRALARGLGLADDPEPPRLRPSAATLDLTQAFLTQEGLADRLLVGFAPGAAYGHAKRWPPRYAADVIARLASERGAACVLVGAGADAEAGREIESAIGSRSLGAGRLVNLIGRTDLRQLIGVLFRCQVFVTNDSGAMHLAAALGRPVVAMFGPTDERATAPLGASADVLRADVFCRPCMLRECPIDHRCMKRLTPDLALETIAARLA